MQVLAESDPDQDPYASVAGTGAALLKEAEKAYGAGDFAVAMQKYTAAADADPTLYEAALFAGDTAYVQNDLPTAAKWFARAIAIDPDRETAYRYWGDAILKSGNNPAAARDKFIDAIVAEPYKTLTWQGIENWTARQKGVLMPPKIQRPAGPVVDPKNPKNINITLDAGLTDDKKNPGASAWVMYPMVRAGYRGDQFQKDFPNEKEYRHTLKEESEALGGVVLSLKGSKIKPGKLDESLRNLVELNDAGMLDCWILINAADEGIAQDYAAYRKEHRQLLHDYIARFVVHGGVMPAAQ
jgi:tetratricopeptide (TPR) repeat protein